MQDWLVQCSIAQVFSDGELGNFEGCLVGWASALKDSGRKCKITSINHELGVIGCGCLDAQVAEHIV